MSGSTTLGDQFADWTGALALGGAGGFAAMMTVPATDYAAAPLAAAVAATLALSLIGLAVMRAAGTGMDRQLSFEPASLTEAIADHELLLVDRLDAPDADSRVVRLFAPETIAVPGELVERIETWLEGARERIAAPAAATGGHGPGSSPASASLHAALADIRRSLG